MRLIDTPFAIWALFLCVLSSLMPTLVEADKPGAPCLALDDNDLRKRNCLAQVQDWQEQRLRIVLDKAMMAASEEDAKAGSNGYGLKVRLLDREQAVWERAIETNCKAIGERGAKDPKPPTIKELSCRIRHLRHRYDELNFRE